MKINKSTMLVEDWQDTDLNEFWKNLRKFMHSSTASQKMYSLFEEWANQCDLSTDQSLVCMTTLFPMRMMESLINSGYVMKD